MRIRIYHGNSMPGSQTTDRSPLLKREDRLELFSPEDGLMKIKKADIKSRARGLSGMLDNMREVLTKREIRDLVEYLASLQ